MKPKQEYCLILHWEEKCFEKKINDALKEGWYPTGGVEIVSHNGTIISFRQALVRDIPVPKKLKKEIIYN